MEAKLKTQVSNTNWSQYTLHLLPENLCWMRFLKCSCSCQWKARSSHGFLFGIGLVKWYCNIHRHAFKTRSKTLLASLNWSQYPLHVVIKVFCCICFKDCKYFRTRSQRKIAFRLMFPSCRNDPNLNDSFQVTDL